MELLFYIIVLAAAIFFFIAARNKDKEITHLKKLNNSKDEMLKDERKSYVKISKKLSDKDSELKSTEKRLEKTKDELYVMEYAHTRKITPEKAEQLIEDEKKEIERRRLETQREIQRKIDKDNQTRREMKRLADNRRGRSSSSSRSSSSYSKYDSDYYSSSSSSSSSSSNDYSGGGGSFGGGGSGGDW